MKRWMIFAKCQKALINEKMDNIREMQKKALINKKMDDIREMQKRP